MSLDKILSKCIRIHMHTPEQGCWEDRPLTERVEEAKKDERASRLESLGATPIEKTSQGDYCPYCCGVHLERTDDGYYCLGCGESFLKEE